MGHVKKAVKNYKMFHGENPRRQMDVQFTMPKALTYLGTGHSVEYKSDKKFHGTRKIRLYRHKFGRDVKLYLHPNRKWLLISGGNFRVTDWLRN